MSSISFVRRRAVAWLNFHLGIAVAIILLIPFAARSQPALVFAPDSNMVVYAEQPDYKWHPASLTKMMTAYLAFEAIRQGRATMDAHLRATRRARFQAPVKLWVSVGKRMALEVAVKAMLVRSANDISVMIAESVGGTFARLSPTDECLIDRRPIILGHYGNSGPAGVDAERRLIQPHEPEEPRNGFGKPSLFAEARLRRRCRYNAFVSRMNDTAGRLGMTRSYFANANGLPDKRQVTTARDMARLASAILRDDPEYADLFNIRETRVGKRMLRNSNSMLRTFEGADGMKTGFVCDSGYNIVVSATRNGVKLIAVLLGARSSSKRTIRVRKLLEYGFDMHAWKAVVASHRLETLPLSPTKVAGPGNVRRYIRVCIYGKRKARRGRKARRRKRARSRKKAKRRRATRKKRRRRRQKKK